MQQAYPLGADALEGGAAEHESIFPVLKYHSTEKDIPRISIVKLKGLRDKLRGALESDWLGQLIVPAMIEDDLLPAVRRHMKASDIDCLQETLDIHLCNRSMSRKLWDFMCVRLSGNVPHLKDRPLHDQRKLEHKHWSLVEILAAERYRSRRGFPGGRFTYHVRTGFMAGHTFKQFIPYGYMPRYGDALGLGKARWQKNPRLYVGMNLFAFLEPASSPERLRFSQYHATTSCKTINKFYVRGRTGPCIYGYNHNCWACPRGLREQGEDGCKYATHLHAWEFRRCSVCGQNKYYERHWTQGSPCLRCREQAGG